MSVNESMRSGSDADSSRMRPMRAPLVAVILAAIAAALALVPLALAPQIAQSTAVAYAGIYILTLLAVFAATATLTLAVSILTLAARPLQAYLSLYFPRITLTVTAVLITLMLVAPLAGIGVAHHLANPTFSFLPIHTDPGP